jgi:hypothetical protein
MLSIRQPEQLQGVGAADLDPIRLADDGCIEPRGGIGAAFERIVDREHDAVGEAGTPTVIGIDEISVRRGHEYRIAAKIIAVAFVALAASATSGGAGVVEHRCDSVTDEGWSVVAERETLSQTDGVPYQSGTDWYVNRVTTVLPFCHYFNSIGVYSMRSYSLDPVVTEERVTICRRTGQSASVAVAPYTGPCPPR